MSELHSHTQPETESYDYKQLNSEALREEYVNYTEGLIAKMIKDKTDVAIFLDKSARPVAWLLKALWPQLGIESFDESRQPVYAPMPEIKFLNIDREQWAPTMGRSEGRNGKGITLEGVHPDTIDSLTGLFAIKNFDADTFIDSTEPTLFDDKRIMVIDEVSASGDTLRMAEALVGKAFANAQSITGTHWMTPETSYDKKSGGYRNTHLPIWYSSGTPFGRGVGDRDIVASHASKSMRQRRGSQFLSTIFESQDNKGRQLRHEMGRLAQEVAVNNIIVTPNAANRDDSDSFTENYLNQVNKMSLDSFIELKKRPKSKDITLSRLAREARSKDKSS